MAEEKQGKPEERIDLNSEPQFVKSPFDTLYSDYTNVQYNFAGFKFTFNILLGKTKEGAPILDPQVSVCLSAEHALQLAQVLSNMLREYQKKNGAIRPEPDHSKESQEKAKS